MSKADLEPKAIGQFIPKQRGVPLISIEKYFNAINSQNKFVSETSTIMIQCLATEAMSAGVKTVVPNASMRALDEHILSSIDNVKRIEQTNDTETKGKWLIVVCDKSERENIREILLIQHLSDVYKRSNVYNNVNDMFYSSVPIVAPPRYDYKTYVERIIPENMLIINDDSKSKHTPKLTTRRPLQQSRLPSITQRKLFLHQNTTSTQQSVLWSAERNHQIQKDQTTPILNRQQ